MRLSSDVREGFSAVAILALVIGLSAWVGSLRGPPSFKVVAEHEALDENDLPCQIVIEACGEERRMTIKTPNGLEQTFRWDEPSDPPEDPRQ